MSKPHTLENSLRIHDVAISNWLEGLHVDYGEIAGVARNGFPILTTYATPSRPFATIPDLLVSRGWIAGSDAATMKENAENFDVLPLPICTLQRLEPTPDPELAGVPKMLRRSFFNQATGQWEQHQWPGHYRTEYTLTFWSLNKFTDNYIREWMYSEFGTVGANQAERFIPVIHDAPWGVQRAALKFVSSSDLSDLEGDKYRFIRTEFTVSLRTWIMRPAEAVDGYPINAISAAVYLEGAGYRESDSTLLDTWDLVGAPGRYSGNLFWFYFVPSVIPTAWPRTGDALVAQGSVGPRGAGGGTLRIEVRDTDDSVELVERVVALDNMGVSIISVAFTFTATEPAEIEVAQRNPTTSVLTSAYNQPVEKTAVWKRRQFFTMVNTTIPSVSVAGSGISSVVQMAEIDIRAIITQSMIYPTDKVDAGVNWHYQWTGLPSAPVLVSAKINSTAGVTTVTLHDDITVPSVISSQNVDSTINVGFVFLSQAKGSTLKLIVPKSLALAWVSLQHYIGPYNGNEA
jgi:hypothetical protein